MKEISTQTSYIFNLITIVAALFLSSGCTNHYVPDATTYDLDIVPDFESNSDIAIINSQESSKDLLISQSGMNKTYANLKDWTDVAIEIVQREFTNKEIKIVSDSPKQLRMSIDSVYAMVNGFTNESEVNLKVETSGGYKHKYIGRVTSYAGPDSYGGFGRAMDGGV